MTQEELDALMSSGDLGHILEEEAQIKDKIISEFEKKTEVFDGHAHKHFQDEHLVTQLDEVTQESEQKAIEIFDKLEVVLNELDTLEALVTNNDGAIAKVGDIRNFIFEVMSIMQYQDIHRQKIERVINTMTAISNMMSSALDSVRTYTPSAKHIAGDKDTDDLASDDDIAALIASMQKN